MSILEKPSGPCSCCKKRPATTWWSDEGLMAAVHGMYAPSCERCVVERQLVHAREMAANIPKLELRLAQLMAEESHGT
jgi:hypothetical protein